jgi:LmbE family N-acetylglucosaminyl deacetylase/predicted NBD/HSP70 family sugar kinase
MSPIFNYLVKPHFMPPLDPEFRPAALSNKKFTSDVASSGVGVPLVFGLERSDGSLSRFETRVFPRDHPQFDQNRLYAERLLKFLLWQRGGWKIYIGGQGALGDYLKSCYSPQGVRAFDFHFMGGIYENEFTIVSCKVEDVPDEKETQLSLGGHLDGCRIGFDLGASDLKVSAVVDGEAIFSKEIEWQPRQQSDPYYHKAHIKAALELAASKMPRVDAIGGSSAGVYINNRPMVASLFRGIPREQFSRVRSMFLEISDEIGLPIEVVNDGEVTALAGSMALEDNGILGIAMGSSEAAGYVTLDGKITGWLNELAFAPVDYSPSAPADEWSADLGCGVQYFSQQCVFRLAPKAGIDIPEDISDAQKLKFVQGKLEEGHEGALKIWQSMGYYLGYAIAHYSEFYDMKHVLILGRCTSGVGGHLILDGAEEVLKTEFPQLAETLNIQLPDEKSRRVGQSIAAASLPEVNRSDMELKSENHEIFIPDGLPPLEGLRRTTHMAIGAHQDDLEIMGVDGILKCFQRPDKWFSGVVMTDGRGSPRAALYQDYTDDEMVLVRAKEQKKAATIGEYGTQVLLGYPSSVVKDSSHDETVADLVSLLRTAGPEIVYTHNLADKHGTHVAVALRVIDAIRRLAENERPQKLYGCEVWRDLGWMLDTDKVVFDCSLQHNLQTALLGVFDSQISGGKRYDLATMGRRVAHATYFASHGVDDASGLVFGMDLTPLITDVERDISIYVQEYIDSFAGDVQNLIKKMR